MNTFRHFLDWNLLTDDQKKSITVATIVDVDGTQSIEFVHPVFVDKEFVLIEKTESAWFWVMLELRNCVP